LDAGSLRPHDVDAILAALHLQLGNSSLDYDVDQFANLFDSHGFEKAAWNSE
jgi:hypothetical protein